MNSEIYIVIGSTGAGKSTYCKKLAQEINGVHFAIDEWMMPLYGPDQPDPPSFAWAFERVERANSVLWTTAKQVSSAGVPVILEMGLTLKKDRHAIFQKAATENVHISIRVLEVDIENRWHRVERRNKEQGETFALHVTRGMFDHVETLWEIPTSQEIAPWKNVTLQLVNPKP
jgi:predicted kinase